MMQLGLLDGGDDQQLPEPYGRPVKDNQRLFFLPSVRDWEMEMMITHQVSIFKRQIEMAMQPKKTQHLL